MSTPRDRAPEGVSGKKADACALRAAPLNKLANLEHMTIKHLLSRREAEFRHTHALRGRLQLFLRSSPPGARGDSARSA